MISIDLASANAVLALMQDSKSVFCGELAVVADTLAAQLQDGFGEEVLLSRVLAFLKRRTEQEERKAKKSLCISEEKQEDAPMANLISLLTILLSQQERNKYNGIGR